jgi:hypothetical protein
VAAYNRAEVLRFTLETVLWQTEQNWELWVVGDACTDETGAVVASFGDDRIQFVNLERNVGEQSGPNREGSRLARGRFVAYLGQDDLWLPDHLELCLHALEETGAGFVFSLADEIMPGGGRSPGPRRMQPSGRRPAPVCRRTPSTTWCATAGRAGFSIPPAAVAASARSTAVVRRRAWPVRRAAVLVGAWNGRAGRLGGRPARD